MTKLIDRLSFKTKLEIKTLIKPNLRTLEVLFDTYDNGFICINDVRDELQKMYNRPEYSYKDILISIKDDIDRLKN